MINLSSKGFWHVLRAIIPRLLVSRPLASYGARLSTFRCGFSVDPLATPLACSCSSSTRPAPLVPAQLPRVRNCSPSLSAPPPALPGFPAFLSDRRTRPPLVIPLLGPLFSPTLPPPFVACPIYAFPTLVAPFPGSFEHRPSLSSLASPVFCRSPLRLQCFFLVLWLWSFSLPRLVWHAQAGASPGRFAPPTPSSCFAQAFPRPIFAAFSPSPLPPAVLFLGNAVPASRPRLGPVWLLSVVLFDFVSCLLLSYISLFPVRACPPRAPPFSLPSPCWPELLWAAPLVVVVRAGFRCLWPYAAFLRLVVWVQLWWLRG